jgi:hypothetical protein
MRSIGHDSTASFSFAFGPWELCRASNVAASVAMHSPTHKNDELPAGGSYVRCDDGAIPPKRFKTVGPKIKTPDPLGGEDPGWGVTAEVGRRKLELSSVHGMRGKQTNFS